MSAPAIVHTAREQWLARRRDLVTASDIAAILGVDPRRGPLAVYAAKVSDVVEPEERRWMAFGRRVEGAIADWYADETGRPALDLGAHEIQVHPDIPWLGATLDRRTAGSEAHPAPADGQGPLEAKAVAGFKAREWVEDPPLPYIVQVQVQMACTGAQWGSLAALVGGIALAWKDLVRDEAFLAAALPVLEAFRMRVLRRDPPEADALPGTSEALRKLFPQDDGETVPLEAEALALADEWEAAKLLKTDAESKVDELGNKLRLRIGSATFGALPDGSLLSLKLTKRAGYTVQETSYRQLRRSRPKLRRR
jgi:putative phage-type endonuclease